MSDILKSKGEPLPGGSENYYKLITATWKLIHKYLDNYPKYDEDWDRFVADLGDLRMIYPSAFTADIISAIFDEFDRIETARRKRTS